MKVRPWMWQLLSVTPVLPLLVSLALWVWNVGGPAMNDWWGAAFGLLAFAWLTAPAWGYPVRNWSRMRQHLEMGGPWCRHESWTEWMPQGEHGQAAWCHGCGWTLERSPCGKDGLGVMLVPWRFRAGLPDGCGPNVDQTWTIPRQDREERP